MPLTRKLSVCMPWPLAPGQTASAYLTNAGDSHGFRLTSIEGVIKNR